MSIAGGKTRAPGRAAPRPPAKITFTAAEQNSLKARSKARLEEYHMSPEELRARHPQLDRALRQLDGLKEFTRDATRFAESPFGEMAPVRARTGGARKRAVFAGHFKIGVYDKKGHLVAEKRIPSNRTAGADFRLGEAEGRHRIRADLQRKMPGTAPDKSDQRTVSLPEEGAAYLEAARGVVRQRYKGRGYDIRIVAVGTQKLE